MLRTHSLTQGPIARGLLFFTLPILFGNILQTLSGSINSIWVGRFLGEAALSATANANNVMFLLLSGTVGLSMAATILVGQYIGAGNLPEAKRVVGTSTTFFFLLSLAICVIGWFACERILRAMNTPADALALSVAYMKVIFLALPFMFLYAFAMAVLRGAGDSKTPLYFLLLSVGLDIALNPLLIFGAGPIPPLGITGSALATLIAQLVSLAALVAYLYRRGHVLVLHAGERRLLAIDWTIASTLVRKGIPMGLQLIVMSFGGILMLTLVNRYGVDTAAAFGAAFQLWNYIQMAAFAIGMAVSAMAAQNVGAGAWLRVRATARVGVVYSVILTGSLVLLIEVFSTPALGMFLPRDSAALLVAEHLNRIAACSFVFFSVAMVLFGVVRATGAVMPPLIILSISLLAIRFPLAELLLDSWQADAIWWSFPISTAMAAIMALLYYKFGGWRQAHMIARPLAVNQTAR